MPGGVSITATQRLKKDFSRLIKDPVPFVLAAPLASNILEWHYVVRGPPKSPYEGGVYHGKLIFPADFPFKPPSIWMLTPNGRFQINTRLCLSISDYHPDTWNPAWTVSTILTGLLSFMLEDQPTLGSIQTTTREKHGLAKKSRAYNLRDKVFCDLFPELAEELKEELEEEARQAAAASALNGSAGSDGLNQSGMNGGNGAGGNSPGNGDHSLAYNLIVLAGVVALAFAVRYVLINAAAEEGNTGGAGGS